MDDSIIWQPSGIYSNSEISLKVDRNFVEKASNLKINDNIMKNMKDLANRFMDKEMNQPFIFEDDSYMVSQFTYDAGKGIWLSFGSLGKNALEVFDKDIEFHSHNADNSYEKMGLMSLVDIWTNYYQTVKDILS